LLLLGMLGGIVALLKIRRRRRRRAHGAPHQRIANGWHEVTDLALDMGQPVPETTTRREAAAFVGDSTVGLAERTDAAVWGGGDLSDAEVDAYWTDLSSTLDAMKSELGVVDRWRAATSIQSLRRRKQTTENGDVRPR